MVTISARVRIPEDLTGLLQGEWERLISEWILKDSYRDIMRRYLCDGWTQEKIAERAGLSLNGTKNIIKRCTDALSAHM